MDIDKRETPFKIYNIKCIICKHSDWAGDNKLKNLVSVPENIRTPLDVSVGVPVTYTECRNCGFVILFGAQKLGVI